MVRSCIFEHLSASPFQCELFLLAVQADNPGVWLYHCHIQWHMYIGSNLYVVEGAEEISAPPANQQACPSQCIYEEAPFTVPYVTQAYGATGYETPDPLQI